MKNFNLTELRSRSRRHHERRDGCRRVIKHTFGSEQWIKEVQSNYILWPKQDRRSEERRSGSRRISERRLDLVQYRSRVRRQRMLKQYMKQPMLTNEEKKMLNDLNRR